MAVSVLIIAARGSALDGEPVVSLSQSQLTGCTYATAAVGGCAGATIRIKPGIIPAALGVRRLNPPAYCHVAILVDGTTVYMGRFSEPDEEAGWVVGLPCDGYYFTALDDKTYTSTATGTISGGTLLQSVLSGAAPAIIQGAGDLWVDGGGAWVAADYNGAMPSVVFNAVSKAGHPSGYPLDYRVWPSDDGPVMWGAVRIPPTTPDYQIGRYDAGLKRKRSAKGSYGALSVVYTAHTSGTWSITAGNTSTTVPHTLGTTPTIDEVRVSISAYGGAAKVVVQNLTSSTFDVVLDVPATGTASGGWDVTRRDVATPRGSDNTFTDRMGIGRNMQMNGASMTNPQALAFRDAQLALRAYPSVSTTVARSDGDGLPTPTGQLVPPHLVQAGQTLIVEGDEDASFLLQTSYDALAGRLSVTCGAPQPGLVTTLRQNRDSDAALRAGVNVLTGSRT